MMINDNQIVPLAPAKLYPRSDEESAAIKPRATRGSQGKKSSKCLVYLLATFVVLCAALLVGGLVVMRASTPEVTLYLVTPKNLRYANDNATFAFFNATLAAEVRIKNTNFGRFKFENTTAEVLYGGVVIGEAKLGAGQVGAREAERMNVVVDVSSHRLSDAKNLSNEINSGTLKLRGYAEFSGRVYLMQIVKKRRSPIMSCNMSFNLTGNAIEGLVCD